MQSGDKMHIRNKDRKPLPIPCIEGQNIRPAAGVILLELSCKTESDKSWNKSPIA